MPLTCLGPSKVVPGATGVFLTCALKKFTPVEIAPTVGATSPPYLCNLISAPRRTISLRRFLALRHQFSSGMCFNIATLRGWYLLAPSTHAPLSDPSGLRAWMQRHHHRYTHVCSTGNGSGSLGLRYEGEEQGVFTASGGDCNPADFEDEEDETVVEDKGDAMQSSAAASPGRSTSAGAVSPLCIQEEHLFEINDGILWEMPPNDDLASPTYWRRHRERMQVYEDTSVGVEQAELIGSDATGGSSHESVVAVEKEQYTGQLRLVRALTCKANVRLTVDDNTQLLVLMPVVDLKEGDELLLHYGREWWSHRLLSTLFMSVQDKEISDVRWVESLFAKPTDVHRPFPLLCRAFAGKRKRRLVGRERDAGREGRTSTECSNSEGTGNDAKVVLYNIATKKKATDSEALIFAVRRSCVDRNFFTSLVGGSERGAFNASRCDDEVPISRVRRVLLQSLRQGGGTVGEGPAKDSLDEGETQDDGSFCF
ncbi:uncharacterized protein TEOVI_000373800 [Trypanosoma equiperdum]|uniref:SET domain-containing protein n=2 Tax=Trypanozoon TaxID=39700 RepID=Q38CC2_TRYB2|nr:hypothetical protein, conserved [Trypanosoma brucei brucei TREU927]EAN77548.1 hypothetical protein, conserved [Trypanosoma brucei brucei TREU927]SCU72162.1 hypothetical protein, conserved [Trypanosoma equiperdum]